MFILLVRWETRSGLRPSPEKLDRCKGALLGLSCSFLVGPSAAGMSSLGLDVKREEMNWVDREDGVEVKLLFSCEGGVGTLGSWRSRFCGRETSSRIMTSVLFCAFRLTARLTFSLRCDLC